METVIKSFVTVIMSLFTVTLSAQSEKKLQLEGELFYRNFNYGTEYFGTFGSSTDQFTKIKYNDLRSVGIGGGVSVGYRNWFLTIQSTYVKSSINQYMHNLVFDTIFPGGVDILIIDNRIKLKHIF